MGKRKSQQNYNLLTPTPESLLYILHHSETNWNQQKIVLLLHCIHEEDDEEFDKYYVSGSTK